MAITPPPELKYGYVVGKIVRTIADDIDADFFPDTVPASGQVTFKPVKSTTNTINYPAIVMHESVTGIVQESTGELYSTTGDLGVWLVVGVYDVVFNLNFGTLTGFQITVTEEHTETNPLDLALYRPVPTDPSTKFVVNEQIYINTLAEADRATAEATRAKTEADRAASQVDTKLASLKASGELTGPAGPSNELSIGSVSATTGDPSASISGTSPSQTLNLTLKTGPKGDQGDKGDKGDQGTGLSVLGSFSNSSQLPATGNPGDAYLIERDLWVWSETDSQFTNVGTIQGPKGDTGDTGPKGDQGEPGPMSPDVFRVVNHGSDANMERPTDAYAVYWVGTAQPANAAKGDMWSNKV